MIHSIKETYQKIKKLKIIFDLEAMIWIGAMLYLALVKINPDSCFSICPFHLIGLNFCPGCGLGHSVSYFLHGNIEQSIQAHWLGPFATIIILSRIFILIKNKVTNYILLNRRKAQSW